MTVAFIHLSDIHFGQEKGGRVFTHSDVRERLIDDVAQLVKRLANGRVNGIIVSGDVAYAGLKEQYAAAGGWLDRLATAAGCKITDILVVLNRSVDLALESMAPSDALRFLLTLSGKFPAWRPPIEVLNKIRTGLSGLTEREPESTISLLLDTSVQKQARTPIVMAGIGDGFARTRASDVLIVVAKLPADDELRLLAYSRAWSATVLRTTEDAPRQSWEHLLVNALQYPDATLRAKARRNVVPLLRVPAHASVLAAVLWDTDIEALIHVVGQIRNSTHFAVAEFDEPLRRSARGVEGVERLRAAILAAEPSQYSDRFLLATIRPSATDIEWILAENRLPDQRRCGLLNSALSSASTTDVQSLMEHKSLGERIEGTLVSELPITAAQLARALIYGNPSASRILHSGSRIVALVDPETKSALMIRMLTVGLSSASSSEDATLERLISASPDFVDAHLLIALAIARNAPPQRVSDNVVLLNRSGMKARNGILAEVEELSHRLAARREPFSRELVQAWADLLADSGKLNLAAQTNAAGTVLSVALERHDEPTSQLIAVAFPIVYAELSAGNEPPGLFSLVFQDWDRCKSARKSIARAFLNSNWPTTDLIRAVAPTGDLNRVLKTLLRERNGEAFMVRLHREVSQLPALERKRMEATINEALRANRAEQLDHFD